MPELHEAEQKLGYTFRDRQLLEACGVQGETSLPWKEFAELVRQKIILTGRRADICPDCQWKAICEKKEKELL